MHAALVVQGGPGDDPITDIVTHGLAVFSPVADLLIAEIVSLGGRGEIDERYGPFYWGPPSFKHELDTREPIPSDFENELRSIRIRLEHERRAGGWEVDRLLDEAHRARRRDTEL